MTNEEKSATKVPDALSVIGSSNFMPVQASGTFSGLSEEATFMEAGYKPGLAAFQAPAETKDGSPVASGLDSTPTNWFELAAELCHSGHITETRFRRAVKAVREADRE